MSHATKIFFMAFSVIAFCFACFLLLRSSSIYIETLNSVKRISYQDYEVYGQYNVIDREIIPKAELIATLSHNLEYNIIVDGQVINKESYDPGNIGAYSINANTYKKSYQLDVGGNITALVYKTVTD